MRTKTEGDRTVAYLTGRIDSSNAEEAQRELLSVMEANPDRELVIDAGELEYISSAGLRVLMKLLRKQDNSLTVQNVLPEVYEIFTTTGFDTLLRVRRKPREFSVEGCQVVGKGAVGTVYRVDADTIVKVYDLPDSLPMIENEQKRAKQAFLKGIPTAISYDVVKVGDRYGSMFELLRAVTFNDIIRDEPDRTEEIIQEYALLLRKIHAVEMEPGELPDARQVYLNYLEDLRQTLPEPLYGRLKTLFQAMPENLHLIHGDIQMKNVMMQEGEPLLIDMDALSVGDPVFDLQGIYVTYRLFNEDDPENSLRFLEIPAETSAYICDRTLERYFAGRQAAEREAAEKKIRIVACVRFLYLMHVLGMGGPALKAIRTQHTLEHLLELAWQVDSLTVGAP